MAIAGVDIGTTGCKCTIYRTDGTFVNEAYQEYEGDANREKPELDAWAVWESVKNVIQRAAAGCGELQAIGVTSFGETLIFADENNRPLMPSILYTDDRGREECSRLCEILGRETICRTTGTSPHSMYSISKMMWVAEHEKEIYKRVRHIYQFGDYVVAMLSGKAQIDYSLACRTMAFDIEKLDWSDEILEAAGIAREKLSKPVPTGSVAGRIRPEVAEELRISEKTMIVSGCHDQIAAAIGTGCLKEGMAVDGTGTVECITPVYGEAVDRERMYENNYVVIPHIRPGTYVTYAFSFNGGSLLKWYRDKIAALEAAAYREQGRNVYDCFNERMNTSEPSGLLVLPYFSGAATPYMDNDAKGAIIGLTDQTTSIDIYQALMEGVTYEMLLNQEYLQKAGICVTELRATGGGARAQVWLQMKADILNKKIISLGEAQSGTLGCIMMAGVACGIYADMEEAARVFVKTGKEYLPNRERHEQYQKYYRKYKKMYRAVSEIWSDSETV